MSTRIKFQGFELGILGSSITWNEYIAQLANKNGQVFFYKSFDRIICLDLTNNPEYILGLFVTIKDLKRFCEYWEANGQFELNTRELEDGSKMAEFNFFVMNRRTHKGVYQFYYSSCSLQRFLGYLKSVFLALKKRHIEEIQSGSFDKATILKKMAALTNTDLKAELLVRPETFDELLKEFDYIKDMKINMTTYIPDSSKYVAFKDHLRKRTEHLFLNEKV
jgi:hypothetical protein